MKIGRFELTRGCILWSCKGDLYPENPPYYCQFWNWLPKKYRYWGWRYDYYDGPHLSFGLWLTNVAWSTPWTKHQG